jgi:hypothetical protein
VGLLQVVTLSVYTYFIAALMGRQFILSDTDMFFPFFTVLQVSARSPKIVSIFPVVLSGVLNLVDSR